MHSIPIPEAAIQYPSSLEKDVPALDLGQSQTAFKNALPRGQSDHPILLLFDDGLSL
jgi:hypothetical protein